jgi:hypothetical protein
MYTWGYLKSSCLQKLDMTEDEALVQGFVNAFPFFANEAMTQICSSIKPDEKEFIVEAYDREKIEAELLKKYGVAKYEDLSTDNKKLYDDEIATYYFINEYITFPDDFVSFSDDVVAFKSAPVYFYGQKVNSPKWEEAFDEQISYKGYNKVILHEEGTYKIPYNARWYTFSEKTDNADKIDVPNDILDAIPLYIVSQCFRKIDDNITATYYRNEYEAALARIDNTSFKLNRNFDIRGGW